MMADDDDYDDFDDLLRAGEDAFNAYEEFEEEGPGEEQPPPTTAPLEAAPAQLTQHASAAPVLGVSRLQPSAVISERAGVKASPTTTTVAQSRSGPTRNIAAVETQRPPALPPASNRGTEIAMRRAAARPKVSDYLLSRPPATGDSESIVLSDGEMFFVGVDDDIASSSASAAGRALSSSSDQTSVDLQSSRRPSLLAVPIKTLLAQLNREAARAATREAAAAVSVAVTAPIAAAATAIEPPRSREPDGGGPSHRSDGARTDASSLWVEKYAPRRFLDLLSSDRLNRNVVRWIKLWDTRVFGRGRAQQQHSALQLHSDGGGGGSSAWGGNKRARGADGTASTGGADSDAASSSSSSSATAGSNGSDAGAATARDGGRNGGGRYRKTPGTAGSSYPRPGGGYGGSGSGKPAVHASDASHTTGGPAWGFGWRPDARVLLFTGAPGMGKTTLAHIAAETTGYRVVEINASDDRSGKSIREIISSAQSMDSVFGDKRPSLVILDEIDGIDGGGAAGGGIGELVRMIKATPSLLPSGSGTHSGDAAAGGAASGGKWGGWKATASEKPPGGDAEDDDDDDTMDGSGGSSSSRAPKSRRVSSSSSSKPSRGGTPSSKASGKRGGGGGGDLDMVVTHGDGESGSGKAVQPLTRPLICICNDPYAPALRELRPLVQIVEFGKSTTERLVARMRAICTAEGLLASSSALNSLAALTDNDVRSCLNTLQFLRAQSDAKVRQALRGSSNSASYSSSAAASASLDSSRRISADMIARAAVGMKDQTKALFDVLGGIFALPDNGRRATAMAAAAPSVGDGGGIVAMDVEGDGEGGLEAGLAAATAAAVRLNARKAGKSTSILDHPVMRNITNGGSSSSSGGSSSGSAASVARSSFNDLMSSMGDYFSEPRLLLSGLEENLHLARTNDPTLEHTARALDWLCYGEEVVARATSTSHFGLLKFVPVAGLGVHLQMASSLKFKVAWPRSDSAMRSATEARRNIVSTFLLGRANGMLLQSAAQIRGSALHQQQRTALGLPAGVMNAQTAVLDLISPLLTILSPLLRSVNFGLLNSREKVDVQALVEAMLSCGLTFAAKQSLGGGAAADSGGFSKGTNKNGVDLPSYLRSGGEGDEAKFVLQPEIHTLVEFAEYDPFDPELHRARLPEVVKQLVAHEIRLGRIRAMHARAALSQHQPSSPSAKNSATTGDDGLPITTPSAVAAPVVVPAHVRAQLQTALATKGGKAALLSKVEVGGDAGEITPSPATERAAAAAGMSFLTVAAQRSRLAQAARKRSAMSAPGQAAAAAASAAATSAAAASPSEGGSELPEASVGLVVAAASGSARYPVVYRYQEGFTNAVRRIVRLRDFI